MNTKNTEFSTKKISETLLVEIKKALKSVKAYGSVEIFIQNGIVNQITTRQIKKTSRISNGMNN